MSLSADDWDRLDKKFAPLYEGVGDLRERTAVMAEKVKGHLDPEAVCPKLQKHVESDHSVIKALTALASATAASVGLVELVRYIHGTRH